MYSKFEDKHPPKKKWVKCVINGIEGENGELYGVTEWVFCVDIVDGIALFSETENSDYVFPFGEESYTHWKCNTT